jgi:ferredoxin-NADP reductase/MOSC domain-containing protein YiiM
MPRLLSVNVGLPRDVAWRGQTVHTGIWKAPVVGRCAARRINLDGDGQGDLAGHGGEQRAVYVYTIEAYRYWEQRLGRHDFTYGQLGENFTVEGMPDDQVCVGDRYRIGTALFEVTQPRVTCYRVGIRMDEPRMAAFLTSSGKPGFYLRVLQEGDVGAGDAIVQVEAEPQRLTVAEASAILYLPGRTRVQLERALRVKALAPGWRDSFEALLKSEQKAPGARGNAGLVPPTAARAAPSGFARMKVVRIDRETDDVLSFQLQAEDGRALQPPQPGQFVVLRFAPDPERGPIVRSYSLSAEPSTASYRISVKREPEGVAGAYLHGRVRPGDVLDVGAPRGSFVLQGGAGPVALLSAGIGVTPVLAMLHALAASGVDRDVWWLHGARNGQSHAFAGEARALVARLRRGRSHVAYSRPNAEDEAGRDFDSVGHLGPALLERLGVPRDADFYFCGPTSFMGAITACLAEWGVPADRSHSEMFEGSPSMTPGIVGAQHRPPHAPEGAPCAGPRVSFARSGVATRWDPARRLTLLELAEACDVPVRWSCRTGVCHSCESGLVAGAVRYDPEPLDPPAEGNLLVCCARPEGDVVIDL